MSKNFWRTWGNAIVPCLGFSGRIGLGVSSITAYELGEAGPGQGPRKDRGQRASCNSYRGAERRVHGAVWEGRGGQFRR